MYVYFMQGGFVVLGRALSLEEGRRGVGMHGAMLVQASRRINHWPVEASPSTSRSWWTGA